jgi:hypothetical protein
MIGTTVQEQQLLRAIDSKAARIGDASVPAEGAERPPITIEGKERTISVAVDASCARHE